MAVKRMRALYAVIRYIPNMLREEFVNVGVILVCLRQGFKDYVIYRASAMTAGLRRSATGTDIS